MKTKILLLAVSFILAASGYTAFRLLQPNDEKQLAQQYCNGTAAMPGTCSGGKNCTACKNCKYCKHCSKNGGTCSVCK